MKKIIVIPVMVFSFIININAFAEDINVNNNTSNNTHSIRQDQMQVRDGGNAYAVKKSPAKPAQVYTTYSCLNDADEIVDKHINDFIKNKPGIVVHDVKLSSAAVIYTKPLICITETLIYSMP